MAEPKVMWYFVFDLVSHDERTNKDTPYPYKMPLQAKDESSALSEARGIYFARSSHADEKAEWGVSYNYPSGGKIVKNDGYEKNIWETFFKETAEKKKSVQPTPWQEESVKIFYSHSPE